MSWCLQQQLRLAAGSIWAAAGWSRELTRRLNVSVLSHGGDVENWCDQMIQKWFFKFSTIIIVIFDPKKTLLSQVKECFCQL